MLRLIAGEQSRAVLCYLVAVRCSSWCACRQAWGGPGAGEMGQALGRPGKRQRLTSLQDQDVASLEHHLTQRLRRPLGAPFHSQHGGLEVDPQVCGAHRLPHHRRPPSHRGLQHRHMLRTAGAAAENKCIPVEAYCLRRYIRVSYARAGRSHMQHGHCLQDSRLSVVMCLMTPPTLCGLLA